MQTEVKIEKTADFHLIAELNKDVHALHYQLYPDLFKPYDFDAMKEFFRERFTDKNFSAFVALVNKEAVGYIILQIISSEENAFKFATKKLYIDQITGSEKYRNMGIAKLLLQKAESEAKNQNISRIELDHWSLNEHAAKFFSSNNFTYGKMGMYKLI